jgi:hypothetical protein
MHVAIATCTLHNHIVAGYCKQTCLVTCAVPYDVPTIFYYRGGTAEGFKVTTRYSTARGTAEHHAVLGGTAR